MRRQFRFRSIISLLAAAGVAIESLAAAQFDEFAGTNLLAGAVFLQTGSGSSLLRTNLSWAVSTNLSHPALVFACGFASDDTFAPGEFFDSFTVTVRNGDHSFVVPVLTLDRLGATLAPFNPDGAQFGESDVQPEELSFPPLGNTFRFQQAFLVLVILPPAMAGQSGTLVASLFDNLNSPHSMGFLSHLAIVPGPGTKMLLESSASVFGPYAKEEGLFIRHARRCLILPRPGVQRFYRLRGVSPSRIIDMRAEGGSWLFHYSGNGGVAPVLESSAQVTGPYAAETGVTANITDQTLSVPPGGVARFFRINCETSLRIRNLTLERSQMVITYEAPRP